MRKFVFVEKLPSGNYSVRHWQNGKFIREWFSDYALASQREADLKKALLAKKQGQPYSLSKLSDLLVEYVNDPEINEGEPFAEETKKLKLNLKPFLTSVLNITDLSTQRIKTFLNSIPNTTTRSIRYRDLHAFCEWCLKKGYLKENPFFFINGSGGREKLPKPKTNRRKAKLSEVEIQALLRLCSPTLRLRLAHIATTGKRKTEILKTEWSHLDLDNATWFIPGENSKSKVDSTVPLLNNDFVEALKAYKKSLPNPTGRLYPKNNFNRDLQKLAKAAGVTVKVTPHVFRHSFASNWKGDAQTLMGLLGWKSPAMIQEYTHLNVEDLRKRAQAGSPDLSL